MSVNAVLASATWIFFVSAAGFAAHIYLLHKLGWADDRR